MIYFISNNTISIKSYYRFIELVSKLCGGGLIHERYKSITLDAIKTESIEDDKAKTLSNSFSYILNNVNQSLSKVIIKDSFYLLTSIILDDSLIDRILNNYYRNINDDVRYRAIYIHKEILNLNIDRKIEYAFIISNYVMLNANRNILIPYSSIYEQYKLNIKINDMNKWLFLFDQMEEKSESSESISLLTIDDIVNQLKPHLNRLKGIYGITFLAIYGSVVKGLVNQNSDIDFLIDFKMDLLDYQKSINKEKVKSIIIETLNAKVDLIEFKHALDNLDINEMENIVVLIK